MMDPRVTPVPPPARQASVVPASAPEEASELSFVPLAASLGARYEPRISRRWVWGLAAVGASTLSLALGLRYSDGLRSWAHGASARVGAESPGDSPGTGSGPSAAAERSSTDGAGRPAPAASPPRAEGAPVSDVARPSATAPASAAATTFRCPEGTALLSRPETRDSASQTYCLDRTEVSADAYAQCVSAGSCKAPRRESVLPAVQVRAGARRRAAAVLAAQCNSGAAGRGQHPMNCVTYDEAESYCHWRGGRLPSDAEWTFAAEGVLGRSFPWGDAPPAPGLVNACGSECRAWYASEHLPGLFEGSMYDGHDGYAGTAPVGSFPGGGTPEGIVDLVGNVAEWTAGSVEVYAGEQGADMVSTRLVRGGAFTSSRAVLAAPPLRQYASGNERSRSVGLRCAFSLAEPTARVPGGIDDAAQDRALAEPASDDLPADGALEP